MIALIILLVVIVAVVIWYVATYNGLINLKTHADESWSQIDVQLQRRNDLIPNLLATVKGYSKYEKKTLEEVTQLRQQIVNLPAGDHQKLMEVSD